jgi:hypothetical protein
MLPYASQQSTPMSMHQHKNYMCTLVRLYTFLQRQNHAFIDLLIREKVKQLQLAPQQLVLVSL